MNERAARTADGSAANALLPIWHLDGARALFAGPLQKNDLHAHSVPVMLMGLYAPFRLGLGGGRWHTCPAAVIPAGVAYEFDIAGDVLAVLYLEPSAGRAETLAPLVRAGVETDGILTGVSMITRDVRALYEACDGAASVPAALEDMVGFGAARAARAMDARIARVVEDLSIGADEPEPVIEVARRAGLSASRFQHLFADEVGVPFRRFRGWQRLRRAIASIAHGASFTRAAHEAGFADQAHFARMFRQTFGAPASPSLRNVRRG